MHFVGPIRFRFRCWVRDKLFSGIILIVGWGRTVGRHHVPCIFSENARVERVVARRTKSGRARSVGTNVTGERVARIPLIFRIALETREHCLDRTTTDQDQKFVWHFQKGIGKVRTPPEDLGLLYPFAILLDLIRIPNN